MSEAVVRHDADQFYDPRRSCLPDERSRIEDADRGRQVELRRGLPGDGDFGLCSDEARIAVLAAAHEGARDRVDAVVGALSPIGRTRQRQLNVLVRMDRDGRPNMDQIDMNC